MSKELICDTIIHEKIMFQNHIDLHEKDSSSHDCNICGKSFTVPARLTRHYRIHTGEKPFQCEYCKKSFSVKENLSVHRRIHTKERPYKCEICGKAFEHSGKLHRHMRIHTGERPHKCIFCDKTFIQSGQLVIHMRTHTGEKPYICKSCGKGFTCSKQLKVHSRTHTGEKPYKCDICNKSFGYNHVLKLHQAAHYGEKFYKCILCQDTFNSKKSMEMHLKNHPEQEFIQKAIPKNTQNDSIKNSEKSLDFRNKIETKLMKYKKIRTWKSKSVQGPEISVFNDFHVKKISFHNNNHDDMTSLVSHKTCSTTNSKLLTLSESHEKMEYVNSCPTVDKISNDTVYHNNFILSGSYRKIQNHEHLKESLPSYYFKSDCTELNDKNILKPNRNQSGHYDDFKNNSSFNELSLIRSNETKSPFFVNGLKLLLSDKIETLSLPPRKRSKTILKSMEMESSKLSNVSQCHSVIKFAKRNDSL